MQRNEGPVDLLFVPPPPADTPTSGKHLKTYTAGEDGSRLAQAAKELGLQQARKPRRQVRKEGRKGRSWTALWNQVVLDAASTEDARIRSVYTHHNSERNNYFYASAEWASASAPLGIVQEDGDDDEEHGGLSELEAHGGGGGNLTAAVLGIIKGMVGPAILYLPHGMANAGYVVAIPIMFVCTFMFLYSSSCLLDSWKLQNALDSKGGAGETSTLLVNNKKKPLPLSYPELAYRALGPTGETLVKTGIALMQSGVCLTYLIFVPQNLHTSVQILLDVDVSPEYWLILMVLIQVPLSWLRDIRKLTVTNLLANALILYGLLVCLVYAFREATTVDGPVVDDNINHDPWQELKDHFLSLKPFASEWYLFIGTSVLLFEGSITLLVPLQESVQSPEQRQQFPAVYQRVILGIIAFYLFFGLTNWMAFGPAVRTVLTTSLPPGLLATSVQLAYSVAVIFTFPLQNFPALEIACRTISSAMSSKGWWTRRNVISSFLVCLLALVAVATMESLDKVVSLMGSLLGCPIAFVFPPMIHSRLHTKISTSRLWGNRIIAGVGVVAMVYSAFTTIATWK